MLLHPGITPLTFSYPPPLPHSHLTPHTHIASSHTHISSSHSHHTLTLTSHPHILTSHPHTLTSHPHTLTSHPHTQSQVKQQKILFESWQDQWANFSHQLSHFEDWVGETEETMTKGMYNDSPAEMEGSIGTVEVCAVMTLYRLASLDPALLHGITYTL